MYYMVMPASAEIRYASHSVSAGVICKFNVNVFLVSLNVA